MDATTATLKLANALIPPNYLKLINRLDEGDPMTSQEISEFLGIHPETAYRTIRFLRSKGVLCADSIIHRDRPGGVFKRYTLGSKNLYKKKTPTQATHDYRIRKKLGMFGI